MEVSVDLVDVWGTQKDGSLSVGSHSPNATWREVEVVLRATKAPCHSLVRRLLKDTHASAIASTGSLFTTVDIRWFNGVGSNRYWDITLTRAPKGLTH